MERYNRDFNNLFDSPNPSIYVFCERIQEEAHKPEKRHKQEREFLLIVTKENK